MAISPFDTLRGTVPLVTSGNLGRKLRPGAPGRLSLSSEFPGRRFSIGQRYAFDRPVQVPFSLAWYNKNQHDWTKRLHTGGRVSFMNKLLYRVLPVLLIGASLAACTKAPTPEVAGNVPTTAAVSISQETTVPVVAVSYDSDDELTDWQTGAVTKVELAGASASVNGTGAAASGNTITILSPGVYLVSGKLSDGQIIVDAQNKGTVRLVLNGADIHSNNSAPIWVKNASKTIITLADGTQNMVSDGAAARAQAGEDEPTAAIFSKDDRRIQGWHRQQG
ncbi:MAG: dockerin type 1 [Symbiobacteriaceae bacterium]|nr:dockerin type 1 [Symbiobacteriaceae bacterium]